MREDDSQPIFDAVAKFGRGPARVTREADSNSIHTVVFHGKTYDVGSRGQDRLAGIIVLVLGLLGLAYVFLTRASRRTADAPASAPASQR